MKNIMAMNQKLSGIVSKTGQFRPLAIICFAVVITTLAACKSSNFPEQDSFQTPILNKDTMYTLGPGDNIRIRVYDHEDLSGSYNVDDTGRISLPLILGVNTRGLTLPELEQKIADELSKNFIMNPKVSIDLVKARPFCILGEIRNPGCFSGIHGMNTAQAIALAGGYTYRAFKEKFVVTREDGRKIVATSATPIFAGDTIEVYERYF
jgi:protein involved in polysaccharide export with SLBB domain